ncbi:MAG: glycosyltransferase [Clostridia bacterium]|nr:glycosyltransferase [Clostridia bacterium]
MKLKVLDGMDSYLPHVDGVINCMHNYCKNGYKKAEITALAPAYKNYVDNQPYEIIRCKSVYFPVLAVQYGRATKDKKFYKKVMEKNYDIVHVHSPFNMAKFMLKVAKKQNIPATATFHTNMRPIFRQAVKSKFIAERMVKSLGKTYNQYDEVFVCSPLVEEQCRSFGYTGKISYLPFGTDFPRCENKEELRKKADGHFGFKEDELIFIYVGRIEKLKKIDLILESLKVLKDGGLKFRFFAIGKGSDMNKMKKLKRKLGFTDEEVTFTGFIDRELFPLMYARGDLLIFPSLYDNFGLVKVEAAAFATAGVFTEGSCAGYGVTDGVNGFLAKDDKDDFAKVILRAVSDRAALKTAGENALRDLYISWEECTDLYLERLAKIAEEHKSRISEEKHD